MFGNLLDGTGILGTGDGYSPNNVSDSLEEPYGSFFASNPLPDMTATGTGPIQLSVELSSEIFDDLDDLDNPFVTRAALDRLGIVLKPQYTGTDAVARPPVELHLNAIQLTVTYAIPLSIGPLTPVTANRLALLATGSEDAIVTGTGFVKPSEDTPDVGYLCAFVTASASGGDTAGGDSGTSPSNVGSGPSEVWLITDGTRKSDKEVSCPVPANYLLAPGVVPVGLSADKGLTFTFSEETFFVQVALCPGLSVDTEATECPGGSNQTMCQFGGEGPDPTLPSATCRCYRPPTGPGVVSFCSDLGTCQHQSTGQCLCDRGFFGARCVSSCQAAYGSPASPSCNDCLQINEEQCYFCSWSLTCGGGCDDSVELGSFLEYSGPRSASCPGVSAVEPQALTLKGTYPSSSPRSGERANVSLVVQNVPPETVGLYDCYFVGTVPENMDVAALAAALDLSDTRARLAILDFDGDSLVRLTTLDSEREVDLAVGSGSTVEEVLGAWAGPSADGSGSNSSSRYGAEFVDLALSLVSELRPLQNNATSDNGTNTQFFIVVQPVLSLELLDPEPPAPGDPSFSLAQCGPAPQVPNAVAFEVDGVDNATTSVTGTLQLRSDPPFQLPGVASISYGSLIPLPRPGMGDKGPNPLLTIVTPLCAALIIVCALGGLYSFHVRSKLHPVRSVGTYGLKTAFPDVQFLAVSPSVVSTANRQRYTELARLFMGHRAQLVPLPAEAGTLEDLQGAAPDSPGALRQMLISSRLACDLQASSFGLQSGTFAGLSGTQQQSAVLQQWAQADAQRAAQSSVLQLALARGGLDRAPYAVHALMILAEVHGTRSEVLLGISDDFVRRLRAAQDPQAAVYFFQSREADGASGLGTTCGARRAATASSPPTARPPPQAVAIRVITGSAGENVSHPGAGGDKGNGSGSGGATLTTTGQGQGQGQDLDLVLPRPPAGDSAPGLTLQDQGASFSHLGGGKHPSSHSPILRGKYSSVLDTSLPDFPPGDQDRLTQSPRSPGLGTQLTPDTQLRLDSEALIRLGHFSAVSATFTDSSLVQQPQFQFRLPERAPLLEAWRAIVQFYAIRLLLSRSLYDALKYVQHVYNKQFKAFVKQQASGRAKDVVEQHTHQAGQESHHGEDDGGADSEADGDGDGAEGVEDHTRAGDNVEEALRHLSGSPDQARGPDGPNGAQKQKLDTPNVSQYAALAASTHLVWKLRDKVEDMPHAILDVIDAVLSSCLVADYSFPDRIAAMVTTRLLMNHWVAPRISTTPDMPELKRVTNGLDRGHLDRISVILEALGLGVQPKVSGGLKIVAGVGVGGTSSSSEGGDLAADKRVGRTRTSGTDTDSGVRQRPRDLGAISESSDSFTTGYGDDGLDTSEELGLPSHSMLTTAVAAKGKEARPGGGDGGAGVMAGEGEGDRGKQHAEQGVPNPPGEWWDVRPQNNEAVRSLLQRKGMDPTRARRFLEMGGNLWARTMARILSNALQFQLRTIFPESSPSSLQYSGEFAEDPLMDASMIPSAMEGPASKAAAERSGADREAGLPPQSGATAGRGRGRPDQEESEDSSLTPEELAFGDPYQKVPDPVRLVAEILLHHYVYRHRVQLLGALRQGNQDEPAETLDRLLGQLGPPPKLLDIKGESFPASVTDSEAIHPLPDGEY